MFAISQKTCTVCNLPERTKFMLNNIETRFKEVRLLYNDKQKDPKDEITLKKLKEISNKDDSVFSRLESGQIQPTLEHVKLYHEQFGVTMEYLANVSNSKTFKNMKVGSNLGVTDKAANTMATLKKLSSPENDYTAVLNAFIGNGKATYNFLNTILTYLYLDYENSENNNSSSVYETLMTSTIINYINNYVKPQLTPVLKTKHKIEEEKSGIDNDDYEQVQKLISSCYDDLNNNF